MIYKRLLDGRVKIVLEDKEEIRTLFDKMGYCSAFGDDTEKAFRGLKDYLSDIVYNEKKDYRIFILALVLLALFCTLCFFVLLNALQHENILEMVFVIITSSISIFSLNAYTELSYNAFVLVRKIINIFNINKKKTYKFQ